MVSLLVNEGVSQVRYFMEETITFDVEGVIAIGLESIVNLVIDDNFAEFETQD